MELPWLKKDAPVMMGSTTREPDSSSKDAMLDSVADELIDALERKDHAAFLEAIKALTYLIKED